MLPVELEKILLADESVPEWLLISDDPDPKSLLALRLNFIASTVDDIALRLVGIGRVCKKDWLS